MAKADRMTWVDWAKKLLRRNKQSALAKSSDAKPSKPARNDPPRRPRFTESLESREMLTAASPINFAPSQFYDLKIGSVRVGQFVNGGLPDLVGVDGAENAVHVLINSGDGTFHVSQTFYVPEARVAIVGDFNHDGNQDIAIASPTNTDNSNANTQDTIFLFFGNGDGTFDTPPREIPINFPVTDMLAADVNGDGYADLVGTVAHRVIVLINRGDDSFFPPVGYAAGAQFAGQLVTGDFNNDGAVDVAVTRFQSNEIAILLGQKNTDGTPAGTFGHAELYHVGTNPRSIAIGDFNGDGKLDLAVANADFRQPSVWVFLGNGDGSFAKPEYYHGGNFVDGITTGDYNGDGLTDIATVSFTSFLRAYAGNGDGTFQPLKYFPTSSYGQSVVSADFNGDGLTDIASATGFGIRVLLATNQTTPPTTPTSFDVTLGNGNPRSITYRDVSGSSATISLNGPGSATVDFLGANLSLSDSGLQLTGGPSSVTSIVATGTTSATTLAITPLGINALATIGPISTDGSFKAILASRASLVGNLSVAGTVGNLVFNNMSSGVITLASAGAELNLSLRNATDETLNSAQPIGSLNIGQWYSSTTTPTTISAPAIRSIKATRQFAANLTIGAGGIKSVLARTIADGTWNVAGPVKNIYAVRDIQVNLSATTLGSLYAGNSLKNVTINTTGNIGSISAAAMVSSALYAGVGPLPAGQRLPLTASDFTAPSTIRSVILRSRFKLNSFTDSLIAATKLGQVSLGVIVFPDAGTVQGLAASSIDSFTGSDQLTKETFAVARPITLAPLTQRGIATADFVLRII